MQARNERENEAGFATIALVLVLVPMILVIGSYLQTMTERNQRLGLEIREEQAMCAAESGIDYALNEARRGTLVAGVGRQYTFTGNLTEGSSFTTTCVYLKGDSLDNDSDGAVDEAEQAAGDVALPARQRRKFQPEEARGDTLAVTEIQLTRRLRPGEEFNE